MNNVELDGKFVKKINLEKTKKAIDIFKDTCSELFEFGKLEFFHYFYCPISVALMEVEEYIREEYESIELLILKLYDSGLTTAESIQKVTGLDEKLINKIIYVEENVYKHIAKGEITEMGKKSINEGVNHVIYEVKKEIQFDALTGTVLEREIEQNKERLSNIRNKNLDISYPQRTLIISDIVKKDIKERLDEYKKNQRTVIDKNYKDILGVETQIMGHAGAYAVSFDYLPDPFIILRGHSYNKLKKKYTQLWKPTSISENNACVLKEKNVDVSLYNIRSSNCFDYLKEEINKFSIDAKENEIIRSLTEGNSMLYEEIYVDLLNSEGNKEFTEDEELIGVNNEDQDLIDVNEMSLIKELKNL